jgi:hypothetical protein
VRENSSCLSFELHKQNQSCRLGTHAALEGEERVGFKIIHTTWKTEKMNDKKTETACAPAQWSSAGENKKKPN